jgi:hypothetical protein
MAVQTETPSYTPPGRRGTEVSSGSAVPLNTCNGGDFQKWTWPK